MVSQRSSAHSQRRSNVSSCSSRRADVLMRPTSKALLFNRPMGGHLNPPPMPDPFRVTGPVTA